MLVALGAAVAVACVLFVAKVVTPGLDALISPSHPPFIPRTRTPRFSAENHAARSSRDSVLPTTERRGRDRTATEAGQQQTAHALASARQAIFGATDQLRAALKRGGARTTTRAISAAEKAIGGVATQIRAALKRRRARIAADKPFSAGTACPHCTRNPPITRLLTRRTCSVQKKMRAASPTTRTPSRAPGWSQQVRSRVTACAKRLTGSDAPRKLPRAILAKVRSPGRLPPRNDAFFFAIPRRMPTANAERIRPSEGIS